MWKASFPATESEPSENDPSEPWKSWPRPPAGFLDLGYAFRHPSTQHPLIVHNSCGNGLLTHILTSEGYTGTGIDLRARSSWTHYPPATQAALKVHALDPTALLDPSHLDLNLTPGVFIIGNHADELTPWIPVLATLRDASGYLSIPCCAWAFDVRYDRSASVAFPTPYHDDDDDGDGFAKSLNLGGGGNHKSSYSMYRIWLASLSMHCGWQVECEVLRIPSTRNWAIVGELLREPFFLRAFFERTQRTEMA